MAMVEKIKNKLRGNGFLLAVTIVLFFVLSDNAAATLETVVDFPIPPFPYTAILITYIFLLFNRF